MPNHRLLVLGGMLLSGCMWLGMQRLRQEQQPRLSFTGSVDAKGPALSQDTAVLGTSSPTLPRGTMGSVALSTTTANLQVEQATTTSFRRSGLQVCSLDVCSFHVAQAPCLYVIEHTDGAGHRMKNIFDGMALAVKNGMNFGGVLVHEYRLTDQHLNFTTVLDDFFGDGAAAQMMVHSVEKPPTFTATFDSPRELEQARGGFTAGASIYCPSANDWNYDRAHVPASHFFTAELRMALRRHIDLRPVKFASGHLSVALHARRGDCHRDDGRLQPDSYYFRLIAVITSLCPDADVHLWSSVKNIPAEPNDIWTLADFDGYRQRGVQVHLDEDPLMEAWTHLARADIFIGSRSSMSYVPAVLSTGCYIYPGGIDSPLDNWVDGYDEATVDAKLKDCIFRTGRLSVPRATLAPTTAPPAATPQPTTAAPAATPSPMAATPTTTNAPAAAPPLARPSAPAPATAAGVGGTVVKACSLSLCSFHDRRAPRLYVIEHTDGAGHRMKNMIDGMAIAVKSGMNFGGILAHEYRFTDQKLNFTSVVDDFFGSGASEELLVQSVEKPPEFAAKFDNTRELEAARPSFTDQAAIFCPSASDWDYDRARVPASAFFTAELRAALRQHLGTLPLKFAPGRVAVAIHARRGDCHRDDGRLHPDSYYYNIVELIRKKSPTADVHLWSSVKNVPAVQEDYWTYADFDGYRQRSVQVHLDEDPLMEAWAHLARADVFVGSRSSMSYVPAVLNAGCYVYPGGIDSPLDNWVNGEQGASIEEELAKCMARATGGSR